LCLRTSPTSESNRSLYHKKTLWNHISFVFIYIQGVMRFWCVFCTQILFIALVCPVIKTVGTEHNNAKMGIPPIHWNRQESNVLLHDCLQSAPTSGVLHQLSTVWVHLFYIYCPPQTRGFIKKSEILWIYKEIKERFYIHMTSKNNTL
jgi:hypothetical protein